MNAQNKVKIEICGSKYVISTNETPSYVLGLAREIDDQLRVLLESNETLSINDGLVLCALNYIDSYRKSEQAADHLRQQLSEYLEDAARARIEVDEAKREIERLKKELSRQQGNQAQEKGPKGK